MHYNPTGYSPAHTKSFYGSTRPHRAQVPKWPSAEEPERPSAQVAMGMVLLISLTIVSEKVLSFGVGSLHFRTHFRRPSRSGRRTDRASGDGRATGRATRAGRCAAGSGSGPSTVCRRVGSWRPVEDEAS
eukprot:190596-Chlamydomonas_euryale.AAC.1